MMLVPGIVHRHIPALLRATPCLVQQLDCKVTAVVSTSFSTESDIFYGYGTVSCFEQKIKEFHSIPGWYVH